MATTAHYPGVVATTQELVPTTFTPKFLSTHRMTAVPGARLLAAGAAVVSWSQARSPLAAPSTRRLRCHMRRTVLRVGGACLCVNRYKVRDPLQRGERGGSGGEEGERMTGGEGQGVQSAGYETLKMTVT